MTSAGPGVWSGEHESLTEAPQAGVDLVPDSMIVQVTDGPRIHYLDWAGPLPAIALLHGIGQTAWSWVPVARRLVGNARILGIDLRGHGLSEAPRTGYDLVSLAWDALTVLAATGSGHDVDGPPVVVAGHGFGAMVAATMARLQPESVAGVALVDGGWEEVAEATRQSPSEFLATATDPPEVLASMETFLTDRRDFDPASWDADQERAARAQVDRKYAGHVALVARPFALRGSVDAMFRYQPLDVLPAVSCPLLVLVAESGAADDEQIRERRLALAEVLRERNEARAAASRVVRYQGAGHNLMRYRPAELTAELLALQSQR